MLFWLLLHGESIPPIVVETEPGTVRVEGAAAPPLAFVLTPDAGAVSVQGAETEVSLAIEPLAGSVTVQGAECPLVLILTPEAGEIHVQGAEVAPPRSTLRIRALTGSEPIPSIPGKSGSFYKRKFLGE